MTSYSEATKSNITWQPRDHLDDADNDITKVAYFTLTDGSMDDLKARISDTTTKQETKDFYTSVTGMLPMWKLLLTSATENHSESFSIGKGVSDSFTVMSMGTNTIKVMFTGLLTMYTGFDYRLDFLYIYDNFFRGYKLEDTGVELQMVIENTVFNLKIHDLHYRQDPTMPDFIRIQITGIAYQYQVLDDVGSSSYDLAQVGDFTPVNYTNIGTISTLMSNT